MKDKEFQQKLVDKLRSGKLSYGDAPIYTIILELVQGNGEEEVFRVFNEVIMEEPKQETLEETIDKASLLEFPIKEWYRSDDYNREEITAARDGFKRGAKWQQERSYSEQEVEHLIYNVCGTVARLQGITLNGNHIDTAYKQFKKK
jgi:hypothetical protein